MIDSLASFLADLNLWVVVLAWCAIGTLEKWAIFHTSQRKGKAIIHDLPWLTPERKEWMLNTSERLGSSVLLLASIPLFGQI